MARGDTLTGQDGKQYVDLGNGFARSTDGRNRDVDVKMPGVAGGYFFDSAHHALVAGGYLDDGQHPLHAIVADPWVRDPWTGNPVGTKEESRRDPESDAVAVERGIRLGEARDAMFSNTATRAQIIDLASEGDELAIALLDTARDETSQAIALANSVVDQLSGLEPIELVNSPGANVIDLSADDIAEIERLLPTARPLTETEFADVLAGRW